jgi:hypothetical protein
MQFTAPWGIHVKIMTIGGSLICLGAPMLFIAPPDGSFAGQFMFYCMKAPLFLWLGSLLFTVRGYSITEDSILIHRLIWTTRFPLEQLIEVDTDGNITFRNSIRCFGNGGIFGISGLYYNRRVGTFRAFVTDVTRTVLLRFPSRTILVSPDDPRRFVSALLRQVDLGSEI